MDTLENNLTETHMDSDSIPVIVITMSLKVLFGQPSLIYKIEIDLLILPSILLFLFILVFYGGS